MNYAEMNVDQLRTFIVETEAKYESARVAGDFVAAEDYSFEMDTAFRHFVTLVEKDDPYSTVADIRYFEGFKYV